METIENIKTDEGYRAEPYICSEGKLTWLYGRNIDDRPITEDEWANLKLILYAGGDLKQWADCLFSQEVTLVDSDLLALGFNRIMHTDNVSNIVLNMAYNMGVTKFNPKKWPKFFKALADKDYKEAAEQMKDSRWYGQVGRRSGRLYKAMLALGE